jgi:hypothetical protein
MNGPPPATKVGGLPADSVPTDLVKLDNLARKGDWAALDREVGRLNLPGASPEVRGSLDALHAEAKYLGKLALLQDALSSGPGSRPPEAEEIAAALASLQGETGDAPLARRVQHELIARAEANGHPDLARKLRDVKLAAAKPEGVAPGPAPASGGKGPVPEADRAGPKPGPKETASKGLPPIGEKAAPSGKSSEEGVGEELNGQVSAHRAAATNHLLRLHDLTDGRKEKKEGDPDSRYEAEVKRALGRELTASERLLAREMRRQGKPPAACAEVLRDLAAR